MCFGLVISSFPSCQTSTLILTRANAAHIMGATMARNGEQQHVVRISPAALPPSPLPFNFPRSPCSLRRRIRSPISARAALRCCPTSSVFLSSKKQEGASELDSQFPSIPCSLSLMQMESRSDLFLPFLSFVRSFIRRRRVTIISTFGYRFCALHPPFLALSLALSLSLSLHLLLFWER